MAKVDQEVLQGEEDLPEVDINLPITKRPLTGYDIQTFQAHFDMQRADVIYALAITNPIMLSRAMETRQPLEFSVELLLRLYFKKPGPAPWRVYSPAEGLTMIYGDVLKLFEKTEHEEEAAKFCERRLVQCFGRHSTTAYRWFDMDGRSKQVIARVLAKLSEEGGQKDFKVKRDLLEDIVRTMYRLRGASALEESLPTRAHPPLPRRRGPVPGSKRKPRARADAAPEAAVADAQSASSPDLKQKLAQFLKDNGATQGDLLSLITPKSKGEKPAAVRAKSVGVKVSAKRAGSARK